MDDGSVAVVGLDVDEAVVDKEGGRSRVGADSAIRWTSGTSSMRRRSMHEALKKVAVGSVEL